MAQPGVRNGHQGPCPADDSFVQWQQGQLPVEQVREVMLHLETCSACLRTLEVLAAADPVSRHLRREPPLVSASDRNEVDGIVRRMRDRVVAPDAAAASTLVPREAEFPFLTQPQTADEIGQLGPYHVRRLLGQGGMGLVFQAEDLQLRRPVALKVMRPEAERQPGAHARFLREARAAAAVRHEHVVTIYQVGEANGLPYLVMEVLQGQSLETRLQQGPPLSLTEIVRIGREVAEGLAAAHAQGLTHRDVKPDNIWLETKSEIRNPKSEINPNHELSNHKHAGAGVVDDRDADVHVKLLDFGLARVAEGEVPVSQPGVIVGTPAYMAPEQACGGPVDARTDLFSLGCVLYRLAAGRLPFQGSTPLLILQALATQTPPPLRQLNPAVPKSLSRLVAALLARRPDDRPASARAVADALADMLEELRRSKVCNRQPRSLLPFGFWISDFFRISSFGFWIYLTLLVGALVVGAVTVLRVQSEQGEIVISTSDPNVAVLFERGKVQLHDRQTGKKYSLVIGRQKTPSGEYELEVTDQGTGLTFSTDRFTLKRGDTVPVEVSLQPKPPDSPRTTPEIQRGPVPAGALKRQDIPVDLLARAGGGEPAKAPPELVAVLGGARHFPTQSPIAQLTCTRYSPDGRYLAACANKEVWVYEAATGRVRWRLRHEKPCGWLDFRPDSQQLAVSWQEGIDLWDLDSGQQCGRLGEHALQSRGLSFTPDGRSLVSTDLDGKARLWDVDRKKVVRAFAPAEGQRFTQAPQIHPQGGLVALHSSGANPIVQVVDLATGEVKARVPGAAPVPGTPRFEYQATVRFSPDGRLLASVRDAQAVHLWDVATWKEVGVIKGGASILSFSADGSTLFRAYMWNGSGGIQVVLDDVKTRTRKAAYSLPIAADLAWSDLSPDGRTIAVRAARANCVSLFDAATGKEQFPLVGHRSAVSSVAVSPDGRWAASTGHDHRTLLWDLTRMARPGNQPPEVVRELVFVPQPYQVMYGAAFSPDGKWVAAKMQETSSPGWIRIWETATGKELITLRGKGHAWQHMEFAFHPQGSALVTAEKNRLEKWRLSDGSSTSWEGGHDQPIGTVAFHPKGEQAASGDNGGVICLWDVSTYKRLRQFRCGAAVLCIRFSPDGRRLAATTAAPDAALYVWDLETGVQTRRVRDGQPMHGLAWRPDSAALATVADDDTVHLWPGDLDQEPRTLRLPGTRRSLAYTPEGRHLLTANEDGSIYVLRLAQWTR